MEQNKGILEKLRNMTSIYLTCEDKILLLFRQGGRVVNNVWVASAGGHFEECELNNPYDCVLRELYEELHISEDMLTNLSLRYITLRRTADEIRQNYHFFAELKNGMNMDLSSDEGRLQWFTYNEIGDLNMPFTAEYVMNHWLETGRHTSELYGGIADGTEMVFMKMPAF